MTRALCCLAIGAALLLSGCRPQPTVEIRVMPTPAAAEASARDMSGSDSEPVFVLNAGSLRFHLPACVWAGKISPENRIEYGGDRETLISVGYQPCHYCNP